MSDEVLADLRARILNTRWTEPAPWGQGTDLAYLRGLLGYWADGFDWRAQRRGQQAPGGLDGHRDGPGAAALLLSKQAHQLAEPGHGVLDPHPGPLRSCLVHHADIVVIFAKSIRTTPARPFLP